jgi:multisite-specific tRNA:(cytosine-C5)-methyltransferase
MYPSCKMIVQKVVLTTVEDLFFQILRASGGSVELLDVSSELPELKRRPGMMSWKVSGHSLSHFF